MNPDVTFGCGMYFPFIPMALGKVSIPGINLRYLTLDPRRMFADMLRLERYDISEMSMMSYVSLVDSGDTRFVGIPVFTSRLFRFTSIYVRSDSAVREAADLRGRRVGIAGYGQSAAVWVRGYLQDMYGISPSEITWVVEEGARETLRPPGVTIEKDASGRSVESLLQAGEVDALVSPWAPDAFVAGPDGTGAPTGEIVRLFTDPEPLEHTANAASGLPLMHTVVMRAELVKQHPSLPLDFFLACCASRNLYLDGLLRMNVSHLGLPYETSFFGSLLESMPREQIWPYGSNANALAIDSFLRMVHEQGLVSRRVERSELYLPDFDAVPEAVWRGSRL